jgi:MFS family permease
MADQGTTRHMVPTDDRRARAATALVFFLTGVVGGTWAARIPAVQERLDLSDGALGVALLGLEGGAVLGLPLGGALVSTIGSRRSLRLGFAVWPAGLVAVAIVPSLASLAAALGAMAAANSVVDVAMNAQGVELERRYDRPVLSGLHAGHSFGFMAGGLGAMAAAAASDSTVAHFACVGAVAAVAGVAASTALVRERASDGPAVARPSGALLVLGLVAFCVFFSDGAANNWSAVHLRSERGADPALAAAAVSVFSLTLGLGRLVGDRLVARLGRAGAVRLGGLVSAAGATIAIASPSPATALAGWAILGAGLAPIAPAVLGAAPKVSDLPAPVAIAAVTTVGYLGSFTGPPVIGALAELSTLSVALGLLVVAAAVAAGAAGRALPSDAARRAKPAVGQENPMPPGAASTVRATVSQPLRRG